MGCITLEHEANYSYGSEDTKGSAGRLVVAAREAAHAGRPDLVLRNCAEASTLDPSNVDAVILRAQTCAHMGQMPLSIQWLREFLAAYPDVYDVWCELSALQRVGGRLGDAKESAHQAIQLAPENPRAVVELSLAQAAAQQFFEAVATLSRAARLAPDDGMVHFHLGSALRLLGRDDEAQEALRTAVSLKSDFGPAHMRLGQTLLSQGKRREAIGCFETALKLDPNITEAHMMWAEALIEEGKDAEADLHLAEASRLDPRTNTTRGFRLEVLGRFEDARACFEQALQTRPWDGGAHYGLVSTQKMTTEDTTLLDSMLRWQGDSRLTPQDQIFFQYALGKTYDDLGKPDKAMAHFREANGHAARNSRLEFDRDLHKAYIDWRIQTFDENFLRRHGGAGVESEAPVFVVGMIRSGTTLVEQALSSHPSIGAGGELRFWYERQADFNQEVARGVLDHGKLRTQAMEYLQVLHDLAPHAVRVVDKMPMNFLLLGMVHLAFPNARIIHCRRNPMDNALSIYTTYFDTSPPYAHIPENIAFYYKEYERLMAFWREVLPADRFIETDYESMVRDRETVLKRLVDFCGLDWDAGCMHHETNNRPVRTPSLWQVRQPIYDTSVERWRKYEPWLDGFEELMPKSTSGTVTCDA